MARIKVWTITNLKDDIEYRKSQKLDTNIAVSGLTGVGKSTVVGKICYRFDYFDPWKHQVYKRQDVINLIKENKFGICWDDEAINSAYKREFQNRKQQELVKTIAMYRSNCNIYFATLPEFFTLDKDIRDLYALHIFVYERGKAIILRRDSKSIYQGDRWYTNYNKTLEQKWQKIQEKNPKFKPPYHKLKGFVAYLRYNDLTEKQRDLYEEVKEKKRAEAMKEEDGEAKEESPIKRIYNLLINKKLTKADLENLCRYEGRPYNSVITQLNAMLKNDGESNTVKYFLDSSKEIKDEESVKKRYEIIPEV